LPAYQFGANFLAPKPPYGAGLPGAALSLMKYGIEHNPDQWRLYYNLGFLYYTELKDYAKAADAFSQGAKLPVTHPFMPALAARMAEHAGEFDTARMLWSTTYQSTTDDLIRQNAVQHLLALQVDEDVTTLERLTSHYHEKTGHFPESFSDLEAANMLRGVPTDPLGHTYNLMPDGRVEVREPDDLPFLEKGIPVGYIPPRIPKLPPVN